MSQSFPRPWYCTRSVHGVVGHQTNIDGVALLRSQETPCDCVPPFVPTKPKKAPIRVTAVRRQRDPWRLSQRDRAVLARLQDPTSRNGGYNEMIDRRQCSPLPPYLDGVPSTMVVPPCERQVADASAPPGINVVRPLTDYLNFYQPEPKRNDFLEPSDLPLSQRALYNLYNPEFGYGGYGPPPAHPPPPPPMLPSSMPLAGEMGYPYPSTPPPLPDAPPLPVLPTTTTTTATTTSVCSCEDRHAAFVPYGICFCPVCGECLLPTGQAPTQTPATCPSTHQRRDHHHAEEWKVPSAVPLQEANYCLLCGSVLLQTPVAPAAAAPTDVNITPLPVPTTTDDAATNDLLPPLPPPPYQSEMPLPIPVPDAASPLAVPTPAIPPPLTDLSLPLPSPPPQQSTPSPLAAAAATVTATAPGVNGSHTVGAGPTYAEINQEDRNMVDLVLNKLVYNVAGQHTTHTNCGLHDCLICHGGGTATATVATAPATVLGGSGTAVCITHNYFYK